MWDPQSPDDFSRFIPSDMPRFLDWWELQHSNAIALQLSGAFVEGIVDPWLELLNRGEELPVWVQMMLRWRLAAQWAYQQGEPLMARLERGLPGLVGIDYPNQYRITPPMIAEIPPQIRQAFLEGNKFSLSWVQRLSSDARSLVGDLLSANQLANRNPMNAVPVLEQVLRRDLIAEQLGLTPAQVTPAMIQEWVNEAQFSVLEAIAKRAELIAVTESARMQNLGILEAMAIKGDRLAYVMPHTGSCPECQRLLDGRVFRIETLKANLNANIGVKKANWKPSLPQHPRCRHSPMSIPWRFRDALERYGAIPNDGILLEFYGLPGGKEAMEYMKLPLKPWLTQSGEMLYQGV